MLVNRHPEPIIIKVLVVDDLRVVREKLKAVLQSHQDIEVIGTATDGENAIAQLEYLQPDIMLLDLDMPNLNGLETAKIIDQKYPQIDVIILSSYDEVESLNSLQAICIKAYIVKANIDLKIADQIRSVYFEIDICFDNICFDTDGLETSSTVGIIITTQDNYVDLWILLVDNSSCLQAIEIGHIQIEQDDIWLQIFELGDRIFTISCCANYFNILMRLQHSF